MAVLVDQASALDGQGLSTVDADVAGHLYAAVHDDGITSLGISCCRCQIVIADLAAVSLLQCDLPHRRHCQRIGGHTVLRDLAQLVAASHRDLHSQARRVCHQLGVLVAQIERMAVLVDQASALDGQGLGTVDADVAGHLHAAVHDDGIIRPGVGRCRCQIVVTDLAAVSLLQRDLPCGQCVGMLCAVARCIDVVRRLVAALYGQCRVSGQGCTGSAGQLERRIADDLVSAGDGQRYAHPDLTAYMHAAVHNDGIAGHSISHCRHQIVIAGLAAIGLRQHDLPGSQRIGMLRAVARCIDVVRRLVAALYGQRRVSGQGRTGSAGQLERRITGDLVSAGDGQGRAHLDLTAYMHAAVHNDGIAGHSVSHCRRQVVIAGLAAISLHQHDLPRHQLVGGHSVLRDLVQLIVSGDRGLYRQAVRVRHQLGILIAQDERIAVLVDEASALDGQGLGTADADVAGHLYAAVHRNGVAVHGIGHGRRQIVVAGLAAVSLLQHDLPGSQRVGVFRTVAHGIDIVRRLVAAYHAQRRVSGQDRTGSAGQLERRIAGDLVSTGNGQRPAHLDLAARRHILQHSDGRALVRVGHGDRQAIIVCRVSILYIPDLVSLQRVDVLAGCGVIRHQTECAVRGFHGQCRIRGQLAVHAVQQEHITALVQLAAVYHDHILCDRLIRRHSHRVVEAQRTTGLVDFGHRRRQLVSGKAGMLAVLVDDHDSAFLGKQLQRQLGVLQADHAVYLPIAGNRGRLVEGLVGRILIDAEFRLEAGQRCAVAVDIQLLQQPARSRHAAAVGRQAVIAFTDSLIRLAVRSEAHADRHLQEVRTQAHSLQCRKHLRAGDLLHSGLQRRRIVIVIERLDRVLQLRPQAVAGRQAVGYGDRHQRRINGFVADLDGHMTATAELCLHGLAAQLLRERDPIQAQAGLVGRIDLDDPRQLLQRILQLLVVLRAVAVQEHIQRLPLGLAAVCAAGNTDGQIIAALGLIHRHIPCRGGQTVTDRGVAAANAVRQILEIQQRIQYAADQVVDAVVIVRSTLAVVAQHVIQQIIAHGIAHMELAVLEQSGDVLNSRVIQRMAVHGHLLRRAVIVQQQIGGQVARQRRHGVFIRIPQRLRRSLQRHIDGAVGTLLNGVVVVGHQTVGILGVAVTDHTAVGVTGVGAARQHHILHLAGDSAAAVGVQNAVHHEVVCLILLRADNIAAELVAAEIHVHILAVDTQRTAAILQQHHERGVFLDGGIQIGQEADPAGAHHYGRVIPGRCPSIKCNRQLAVQGILRNGILQYCLEIVTHQRSDAIFSLHRIGDICAERSSVTTLARQGRRLQHRTDSADVLIVQFSIPTHICGNTQFRQCVLNGRASNGLIL